MALPLSPYIQSCQSVVFLQPRFHCGVCGGGHPVIDSTRYSFVSFAWKDVLLNVLAAMLLL